MNFSPTPPIDKVCRKCGIPQPLEHFPFRKAESRALHQHPDHAERIREAERIRSKRRRPAILKWQREHPDNMRPGYRRRAARRQERLAAARLAVAQSTPIPTAPSDAESTQAN